MVAGAAAALFVVAAAIELWGVHHQLGLVRAERERIHPEIASTMVGRTTVDAAYRHLATLNAIERASPQWSSRDRDRSRDALPDDAHLMAIRTRDDSVIVDGAGRSRRARVRRARAGRPAHRREGGGRRCVASCRTAARDALEHFAIAARVARPTTAARRRPRRTRSRRRPGPMKWSTMSRRATGAPCCSASVVLLPALLFIWGVRPYQAALSDARDQLATERATLARERAAIATARRNPQLQHIADSAMRAMRPRLFEGKDDVMASAELASYLGEVAQQGAGLAAGREHASGDAGRARACARCASRFAPSRICSAR